MIKFLKIGALLIVAFSFANCKKTVTGKYYTLSADALSYVQLKQGKYFIYRDSVAGVTDSVVVTQSLVESYDGVDNGVPYNSQQFSLTLTQINKGSASTTWLKGMSPGRLLNRLQLISADNPDNILYQDMAAAVPNLVIDGKTYTNVTLTTNLQGTPNTSGYFKTAYYWSKGLGLIKRSETKGVSTNTYLLLRHN